MADLPYQGSRSLPRAKTLPPQGPADTIGIEPLLSPDDLAAVLSVSRSTVERMKAAGRLPQPIRLGRSVRWRPDDVRRWIDEQATGRKGVAR